MLRNLLQHFSRSEVITIAGGAHKPRLEPAMKTIVWNIAAKLSNSKGAAGFGRELETLAATDEGWEQAWMRLLERGRVSPARASEYSNALDEPRTMPFHALAEAAARSDWDEGRRFHLLRATLGGTIGGVLTSTTREKSGEDVDLALERIEAVGWRLDHRLCVPALTGAVPPPNGIGGDDR